MNALAMDTGRARTGPRVSGRRCLTLNASYEPLTLVTRKRAVRLVLAGKADIVEAVPGERVRSEGFEIEAPAVIRLAKMVRVPRIFRKNVTNTFLRARERGRCGYCGRHESQLGRREFMTRDHIIPQSRFTPRSAANTFENCVLSCSACNNRKADRTPEEAGMKLLVVPTEPDLVYLHWRVRRLTDLQRKYIRMFFGEKALDDLR